MKQISSQFLHKINHTGFYRDVTVEEYQLYQATHAEACGMVMFNCRKFETVMSSFGYSDLTMLKTALLSGTNEAVLAYEHIRSVLDIFSLLENELVTPLLPEQLLDSSNEINRVEISYCLKDAKNYWGELEINAFSYGLHGVRYPLSMPALYEHGQPWWEWLKSEWVKDAARIQIWLNNCVAHTYLEEGFERLNHWALTKSVQEKNQIIQTCLEMDMPFESFLQDDVHHEGDLFLPV